MKKTGVSYAGYYNRKYERTGHLFQDRYKSENVTNERYLLTVYRYILNNPEKAGICRAKDYPWSSYSEYGTLKGLTDTSLLAELVGGKTEFAEFMGREEETECMEDVAPKHDDKWAMGIIKNTVNAQSGTIISQMPRQQRDEVLAILKGKGISVRQLERLTGINRGIIQKAGGVNENRPR